MRLFCCSFTYFTRFSNTLRRLRGGNLMLNIISFGIYSKLGLFWPIRYCFRVCFSIRLVSVVY